MKKCIFTFCCTLLLLTAGGCCGKKAPQMKMERNALLIDVRTSGEFDQGFLQGAVNLPHDQIGEKIQAAAPDKKTPLYLYCRSGRRVGIAMKTLRGKGYTVMHDLGGFEEARARLDLPVIKKASVRK